MAKNEHGLGRIHKPDERDFNFPLAALLPEKIAITEKYWFANGYWGNQGEWGDNPDHPYCVAAAWVHWIEDGPIGHPGTAPCVDPLTFYNISQTLDEIPGTNYEGSTTRGGAKAAQQLGYVQSYHWGWTLDQVVNALLGVGPVVTGTNWWNDMFEPDRQGIIRVGGGIAGGHDYVLDGVSIPKAWIRMKNSWGRQWGHNGFAYIPFEEYEKLLTNDGDACLAIENKKLILPA